MFCAKCGAENPSDNLFCGKCGAPLENNEVVVENTPAPEAPQTLQESVTNNEVKPVKKKSKKGIIIALVILILILIAAGCIIFFACRPGSSNTPKGVTEKLIKGVAKGDADALQDCNYGAYTPYPTYNMSYIYASIVRQAMWESTDKAKITYKVHDYYKAKDEEKERLEKNIYKETNQFLGYESDFPEEIDEAGYVSVVLRISDSVTSDCSQTLYAVVVKIDGEWFVYSLEDAEDGYLPRAFW